MSSNCTFDFLVIHLNKKCSNLNGFILRIFNTREIRTMDVHCKFSRGEGQLDVGLLPLV